MRRTEGRHCGMPARIRHLSRAPKSPPHLATKTAKVREAALEVAAARRDESLLPAVIPSLGEPRLAPAARRALSSFDGNRVTKFAAEQSRREPPGPVYLGMLRALADISSPAAIDVLVAQLGGDELEVASTVAKSVRRISGQHPIASPARAKIEEHCMALNK